MNLHLRLAAVTALLTLAGASAVVGEEDPGTSVERYTCGQASLFAIARLKGAEVKWPDVAQSLAPQPDGTNSLAEVEEAAKRAGLHPLAVRMTPQQLCEMAPPAILHFAPLPRTTLPGVIPQAHFAVAVSWDSRGVVLLDPPRSARVLQWSAIAPRWTGNAMVFLDSETDVERVKSNLSIGAAARTLPYAVAAFALAALLALSGPVRRNASGLFRVIRFPMFLGRAWRLLGTGAKSSVKLAVANPRVSVAFAVASLAIIIAAAEWSWTRWAVRPQLEGPAGIVEQGFLAPGEHKARVALRNSGGAPLRVSKIESSCSCAVAAPLSEIGTGETRDLEVTLHGAPGSRFADLFIYSNDPLGPRQITFHWTGAATPWLLAKSIVAEVNPAEPYHDTIVIAYPGGFSAASPAFGRYECSYPGLMIEPISVPASAPPRQKSLDQNIVAYREFRLTVLQPHDKDELETKCNIFLKDSEREQSLGFSLRLVWRGRSRPRPEYAVFAAGSGAALVGQERTVEFAGSDATSNLRIASCPDWLKCTLAREKSGGYRLSATVARPPGSRFETGKVVVVSERGSKMELRASAVTAE